MAWPVYAGLMCFIVALWIDMWRLRGRVSRLEELVDREAADRFRARVSRLEELVDREAVQKLREMVRSE